MSDQQITVPPVTNPPPPPPTLQVPNDPGIKKSKNPILIFVIVVLLFLSIVLNIIQYLGLLPGLQNSSSMFPLNPNASYITNYGISYYFETTVRSVQDTPQGKILVTEIEDPQLPQIILQADTPVYTVAGGEKAFDRVDKNNLRDGQKVGVLLIYSELQEWKVVRVTLFP